MNKLYFSGTNTSLSRLTKFLLPACLFLVFALQSSIVSAQYNFAPSGLKGIVLNNPTSLQFGPDGRLYVSQQNGIIMAFTIKRNAANDYIVIATETIDIINQIPNHDDDGTLNPGVTTRQVTGILVKGTAIRPIIYVTSSDSRTGGGGGGDLNLDTNSGIISLLTKNGSTWQKTDLVRGLPRSEENHATNGIQLNQAGTILYITVGGFTNAGSPSVNFAYACEYALSAAILSIDLTVINGLPLRGTGNGSYKYDLPTLDDPTRSNNPDSSDLNDPFGGNNGLNQAKLVKNGPVQIFASGLRNSYDLLITKTPGKAGRMYTIDNGANEGWGGYPENENTKNVTNNYLGDEPGSTGSGVNHPIVNNLDNLHYVGNLATYLPGSFYGGHPNPIRANPASAGLYSVQGASGVWRNTKIGALPLPVDWPPVPLDMANPIEANFLMPGVQDNALLTFGTSTNGLAEYTASNFNNELKGNILALGFNDGNIFRIKPTADGTDVLNSRRSDNRFNQDQPFASGFGAQPLDIVAQGDSDIYPGTIWVATYGDHAITVFEPQDFVSCTGKYDFNDDDKDGYTNADEVDNGTNPCSAASKPPDFDHDFISDLNDPDDDNDGIPDIIDLFPLDASNGLTTHLPVKYNLFNNDPGTGFFGLGFTGLMSNRRAGNDYLHLFKVDSIIAGGAVGALTLTTVTSGDALGLLNNQENAFQFGVSPNTGSGPFTVNSRMLGPFFNSKPPVNYQSQGIFIGTGDQSNYIKITLNANGGNGGIEVVYEKADSPVIYQFPLAGGIPASTLDLYFDVNPVAGTVQPKYAANNGIIVNLGSPILLSGELLNAVQGTPALAVGIISTSRGATSFLATWDYLYITYDPVTSVGSWQTITPSGGLPTSREENSFVDAGDKFYLLGGRGINPVQVFNPANKTWADKMPPPVEINHFQAITLGGLIYTPGAFTGAFPHEKPVSKIYMYNPTSDKWMNGATIPVARRRGAAGAVAYKNKIYLVCGITDGHYAGWVKWFDEYDPLTNTWKTLPDAPRARDHFHAVIVNDKLYVTGGRLSSDSTSQVWTLNIPEVDVYDFISSQWSTLPAASNIPTPRAGAATTVLGNEIVVIGGESDQPTANIETEALNVQTNAWRRLADMQQRRHGTQVIKSNNGLYIAAGAGLQGGANLLTSTESFYLFNPTAPNGVALVQSQLTASLDSAFNYVPLNAESNRNLTLSNTGGSQDILLTSISFSGAASFSSNIPYTLPFVIPAGKSLVLNIKFKPITTGLQSANMLINNSGKGDSLTVALNGNVSIPYYRINAGGSQISTSVGTFTADTLYSPVPGDIFTTPALVSGTADPIIYQTERNSSTDTFSYAFPVPNGNYLVTLHFAELFYTASGLRIFDVSIEGSKVLDNYDIIKKAGFLAATTESIPVTVKDGVLNIYFSSLPADGGRDRPKVNAIEILSLPNSNLPVSNAGSNIVVQLPANSITLIGSGTEQGGSIRSYNWTQLSGPNTAVFGSAASATPIVSQLIAGTYLFSLTVTDAVGFTSLASQVFATVNNPLPSSGLNYRYYEGNWNVLPNFNTLSPVNIGVSPNVDLSIRNKADSFGIVWEGNIYIPTAGSYTFETVSDEGSKLYFNSLYAPETVPLVNNDSLHLARSASGTVSVSAAGLYPIAISYFDKTGADSMKVYWSGPGFSRQPISATSFGARLQVDTAPPTSPANLKVLYTGRTFINLDWDNSTDSVGVTGYDIYVNGIKKYSSAGSAITADSLLPATSYSFSVRARDLAGNTSVVSAVVTGVTTSTANGLNYRYYEGTWNVLPDFNALNPVKSGVSTNVDLSVRNKTDSFGIVWEGYINIPLVGSYTFETVSDEGSKLYFNSFYNPAAAAFINNDSIHLARSVAATVVVGAPGLYPVAVAYFDRTGGDSMRVYWSGPGFNRQPIPNGAFTQTYTIPIDSIAPGTPTNVAVASLSNTSINLTWTASTDNVAVVAYDVYVGGVKKYTTTTNNITADSLVTNTTYSFTIKARDLAGNISITSATLLAATTNALPAIGLNYRYYEGSWNLLPDFNALIPVKTGMSVNIDLSVRNRADSFAFVWEGYIYLPASGNYTFETISDEGSKFYFNSLYNGTATALVNNDSIHLARSASGTVAVSAAGLYPVSVTYFEKSGADTMKIYWTGPGFSRQLIPNTAFGGKPQVDTTAPTSPSNLKVLYTGRTFVNLDWDNSTDSVGVTGYDIYVNGIKKYSSAASAITADSLLPATSYSFSVRARDLAGNTSVPGAVVTGVTTSTANGLNYRYYEGAWSLLPDFNSLTPVKTGVASNIDLSVRNKTDSFGIVWEGYINILTAGSYTFETFSDEGSKLYFNSFYNPAAIPVVNNDSLHLARSASGTVSVGAAGLYPLAVSYFDKTGTDSMKLYWTGPGIARQLIPATAFTSIAVVAPDTSAPSVPTNVAAGSFGTNTLGLTWTASTDNVGVVAYDVYISGIKKYTTATNSVTADSLISNTTYSITIKARDLAGNTSSASNALVAKTAVPAVAVAGLNYKYYQGTWSVLPDFTILTPVKIGTSPNIDISIRPAGFDDFFGFVWEGYINIPTAGTYTFETISDDGSRLYFNSLYIPTATAIVNNDGLHGANSVTGNVTVPAPGYYPVSITYFERDGGQSMQAYWSGPGIPRQLIPNLAFASQLPADSIAPSVPLNLTTTAVNSTFINLAWNPSTDNVGVTAYDVYLNNVKKYSTNTTSVIADNLLAGTSYVFTVKALDFAGNTSAASTALAVQTTSTTSGLTYRYYEGNWDVLPNFNLLTPVKTGITPNIDIITVRNQSDYYGFVWEGNINIPTAGTYTFETISDDGSKLYFNQKYAPSATALVSNDGLHGPSSVTGNVTVAAGNYPIAITFFEKNSGESMQVYWSGPGIPRQLIPSSAFIQGSAAGSDSVAPTAPANVTATLAGSTFINLSWTASTDNVGVVAYDIYAGGVKQYTSATNSVTADNLVAGTAYFFTVKARDQAGNMSVASAALSASTTSAAAANGLNYRYYEGNWDVLPNFNLLTPVKTGTSANVDITVRPAGKDTYYGFVWEGAISVPAAGNYTFETVSDDGSRLYFNSVYNPSITSTVNNDGLHAAIAATTTVNISAAGSYPIAITFFQKDGGQSMQVYWSGPGIARQLIPDAAFSSGNTASLISVVNANRSSLIMPDLQGSDLLMFKAYPNPFYETVTVSFNNNHPANKYGLAVYDFAGELMAVEKIGKLPGGKTSLKLNWGNRLNIPGIYTMRLIVNGIPRELIKLIKVK